MSDAVDKLRMYVANAKEGGDFMASLSSSAATEIVRYIDALEKERDTMSMWKFIAGYLALSYESYGLNPDAMLAEALQAFDRMENGKGVDDEHNA